MTILSRAPTLTIATMNGITKLVVGSVDGTVVIRLASTSFLHSQCPFAHVISNILAIPMLHILAVVITTIVSVVLTRNI